MSWWHWAFPYTAILCAENVHVHSAPFSLIRAKQASDMASCSPNHVIVFAFVWLYKQTSVQWCLPFCQTFDFVYLALTLLA